MKKNWIYLLCIAFLSLVSCVGEDMEPDSEPDEPTIRLELKCAEPGTKAGVDGTEDGVPDWNENLLNTIDVFFYKDGATGSNAIIKRHFSFSNQQSMALVDVNLTNAEVSALVPTSQYFYAYVVANWATDLTLEADTSLDALKALTVSTDFASASDHIQDSFIMSAETRLGPVRKKKSLIIPTATIPLKRLAAKLDVRVFVEDRVVLKERVQMGEDVVEYEKIWIPLIDQMQVYLENGVEDGVLDGHQPATPSYFSYRPNPVRYAQRDPSDESKFIPLLYEKETRTETVTVYDEDGRPVFVNDVLQTQEVTRDYWVTDPMYVYPQHWSYGENRPSTGNVEPTLKLLLPWSLLDSSGNPTNQKMFYYKVIIPEDPRNSETINGETVTYKRNFVRNNLYRFRIRVAILGSETDEAAVAVTGEYAVAEWQDRNVIIRHAEIGAARYLSIPRTEYTMYNTEHLSIPVTTSHTVQFKDASIRVTKPYFGSQTGTVDGGTVKTATAADPYPVGSKYIEYTKAQRQAVSLAVVGESKDWFRYEGGCIVIDHALVNSIDAAYFDYSPYRFQIVIEQPSDTSYSAEVVVIQNPAIIIEQYRNNDTNNNRRGYVYINGSNSQNASYGGTTGALGNSGANNSPYMYVITTSVLDATSSYILGDVRKEEIDNNLGSANNTWSASLTPIEGGDNRRLSYYHPADDDPDKELFIAPSFRVASSYGKTTSLSYNDAQKRCASYQESGYPAGRWRIPTRAEIEYMIRLSQKGVIPSLFTPDDNYRNQGYWCSTGVIFAKTNGDVEFYTEPDAYAKSNSHNNFPRCVYDTWYWGNDQVNLTTPTWGDAQ
ncbi:MAG: hypothetical protein J6W74_01835 [Bacteroidales bacterium]|nr:hypothetical protein [Bacteroidales bacterium]